MANAARPAATIAPEPLELPHVQHAAFQGFFAGPVSDAEANRYPIPPASSIIADLPIRIAPARSSLSITAGIVVELLIGIRPRAPCRRVTAHREQIFRGIGDSMQRPAVFPRGDFALGLMRLP